MVEGETPARAQTYVHDRLVAAGLKSVGYQYYGPGPADRSVVAEIPGTTRAGEVVVVGAHLDDMPAAGRAPGADDNGASCAALLYLARHLSGRRFARTLRFVFFGGEEIGYLGSGYAAGASRSAGEDVVAMLNADAIGWNGDRTHVVVVHRRPLAAAASAGRDRSIATTFVRALSAYGIGLRGRVVADGATWSDHASYWRAGFGAVCVIEDRRLRSNPVWHTSGDRADRLSWSYYLSVTKALLATTAHLARIESRTAAGVHSR